MLEWTTGIARRGFVASVAWIAIGGVALAQAVAPIPAPAPNTATAPPASSVAASTTPQLTQAQLEQLVAPIALYPDPLLAQILIASTYPLEVVEAARWVGVPANRALTGNALTNALQAQNWDPSVQALVPFPRVLQDMSDQLQWTEELGNSFLAQQADVMAAVQALRREAMAAGNLKQTPQCHCVIQSSGESISILPAEPQVVCAPVYSPAVYGAWPYPAYPPYSFPVPAGLSYAPGYWIGYEPPIEVAVLGPLWGWGWPDWEHHYIAVNAERYALASGGHPAFPGSVWVHNPAHRGGVPYPNAATRARFNAARVAALTAAARSGAGGHATATAGFGSEAARGGAGRFGAAAPSHEGAAASRKEAAVHANPALRGRAAFHGAPAVHGGPASRGGAPHRGGGPHFAMAGPRGSAPHPAMAGPHSTAPHFAMAGPRGGAPHFAMAGPRGSAPHPAMAGPPGGGAPHFAMGGPRGGGAPHGGGPHGGGPGGHHG